MANKPAHEIRLGRIKAVIWRNETEAGPRLSVSFVKLYRVAEKDREKGDSGWRETQSFGRDELLQLAKVADQAHSWCFEHRENDAEDAA